MNGGFKGFVDIPCAGDGGATPFFAIEVDPHKAPPSEIAQMLTAHYEKRENQEMGFAFVVQTEGAPWSDATAQAWARQFVDGFPSLLGHMVDELTMVEQGWPVVDIPIFGRIRFLALGGFGRFVERTPGVFRPEVDVEGKAILAGLRGAGDKN